MDNFDWTTYAMQSLFKFLLSLNMTGECLCATPLACAPGTKTKCSMDSNLIYFLWNNIWGAINMNPGIHWNHTFLKRQLKKLV